MLDPEAQIIDLQARLAYQDDALLKLSDVLARQQQQIDQLTRAVSKLGEQWHSLRLESGAEQALDADEKPPHY